MSLLEMVSIKLLRNCTVFAFLNILTSNGFTMTNHKQGRRRKIVNYANVQMIIQSCLGFFYINICCFLKFEIGLSVPISFCCWRNLYTCYVSKVVRG